MKFVHALGRMSDADEHCRRYGDKCLRLAKSDFKRFDLAANFLQGFKCGKFAVLYVPWRENSEVHGEVRQLGMKVLAQAFDELPCGIIDIGHQGVTRILHGNRKIIPLIGPKAT